MANSFEEKLKVTGLTRREITDRLGVHYQTSVKWKRKCPVHVHAYLDLMMEMVELKKRLSECEGAAKFFGRAINGERE